MRNCEQASTRCGMAGCSHEDCKKIAMSRPCTCPSIGQYYFSHDSQEAAVAQAAACRRHSHVVIHCIHCNQTEQVCSCNVEDPRTYWSIILPYVTENATKWHPTEKSGPFSTMTRGCFASKAKAYMWAKENIPGHTFTLNEYARGNYIAPAFDSVVLMAAVSKYFSIACGRNTTDVLLDDSIRQETAEWMHLNHPIWIAQFNMDLVEWILVTYHGLKNGK